MNNFPTQLTPANLGRLAEFRHNRQLCYLRKYIYEAMLAPGFAVPANCGISLSRSEGLPFVPSPDLVRTARDELAGLGWETTLGYGGTVLFVHTADVAPNQAIRCDIIGEPEF